MVGGHRVRRQIFPGRFTSDEMHRRMGTTSVLHPACDTVDDVTLQPGWPDRGGHDVDQHGHSAATNVRTVVDTDNYPMRL